MPSSAQHQSTFCTFDEVVRPQIFSIAPPPAKFVSIEPQFLRQCNSGANKCIVPFLDRIIAIPVASRRLSDEPVRIPAGGRPAALHRDGRGKSTGSNGDQRLEGGG